MEVKLKEMLDSFGGFPVPDCVGETIGQGFGGLECYTFVTASGKICPPAAFHGYEMLLKNYVNTASYPETVSKLNDGTTVECFNPAGDYVFSCTKDLQCIEGTVQGPIPLQGCPVCIFPCEFICFLKTDTKMRVVFLSLLCAANLFVTHMSLHVNRPFADVLRGTVQDNVGCIRNAVTCINAYEPVDVVCILQKGKYEVSSVKASTYSCVCYSQVRKKC
jgi:hypothetical protein